MESSDPMTNRFQTTFAFCFVAMASMQAWGQATITWDARDLERLTLDAEKEVILAGPMLTWDTHHGDAKVWLMTRAGGRIKVNWERAGNGMPALDQNQPQWLFMYGRPDLPDVSSFNIGPYRMFQDGLLTLRFTDWVVNPVGEKAPSRPLIEMTAQRIPAPSEPTQLTLAFGSCSHQEKFGESQPIWNAVVKEKPDVFLFIGDNIYAPGNIKDYPDDKQKVRAIFRELYAQNRQTPELQPLLRSAYCFGLWDDHDYGPNNSDRTFKHKDVAFEVFREFFPGTYGLPAAPGCFQKITWGDVDIFMLDDRSFRDANRDGERKSMFGAAQLNWLKSGLKNSTAKVKLIVNGNQMLSDKHIYESWGGLFPDEWRDFLQFIWDNKITGTIFLAGDRHFSELIRKPDPKGIGPDLYELTSSPLANGHFERGGKELNPERVAKYTDGVNFGLLKIDTTVTPPVVEMMIKDVDGKAVINQRVIAH